MLAANKMFQTPPLLLTAAISAQGLGWVLSPWDLFSPCQDMNVRLWAALASDGSGGGILVGSELRTILPNLAMGQPASFPQLRSSEAKWAAGW